MTISFLVQHVHERNFNLQPSQFRRMARYRDGSVLDTVLNVKRRDIALANDLRIATVRSVVDWRSQELEMCCCKDGPRY
jgi:hypothetical protein